MRRTDIKNNIFICVWEVRNVNNQNVPTGVGHQLNAAAILIEKQNKNYLYFVAQKLHFKTKYIN